jgi:hypothetical protein
LRQVPYHLAHIEDEKLLREVFGRPYETRTQWLARLAATFRPMHALGLTIPETLLATADEVIQ